MNKKYPSSHVSELDGYELRPQERWQPAELEGEIAYRLQPSWEPARLSGGLGNRTQQQFSPVELPAETAHPTWPLRPATAHTASYSSTFSTNHNFTPQELEQLKQMQYWENVRKEQKAARDLAEIERIARMPGKKELLCSGSRSCANS